MPSIEVKKGSLHIHQFYVDELRKKSQELLAADPKFAFTLDCAADLLAERVEALAEEIEEEEYDD